MYHYKAIDLGSLFTVISERSKRYRKRIKNHIDLSISDGNSNVFVTSPLLYRLSSGALHNMRMVHSIICYWFMAGGFSTEPEGWSVQSTQLCSRSSCRSSATTRSDNSGNQSPPTMLITNDLMIMIVNITRPSLKAN